MFEKTISLNLTSRIEILIFVSFSALSLIVPFSLGYPQWLVGATVNACLFLAAIFLPKKFFIPLVVFPSLGVLARGLIFGPFTQFLVYFLPFIWLGNLILILIFKALYKKSSVFKYFFFVFCAAGAKYLFLMAAANFYFKIHLVPAIFLQTMGINQLLTALSGGLVSWIALNLYAKHYSRDQRTA
jgi:hypothetical protein